MIKLHPDKLRVPIRARVGKINTFYLYGDKPIVYFTGIRYEWCQCELTQALIDDFCAIFGSENVNKWTGREIEIYARNGEIRARLYQGKGIEYDSLESL
jgi:hypothetical protein